MEQADANRPARIESLDEIRGLAVLGILAVNAAYFAAPWYAAMDPHAPPLAVSGAAAWSWFGPRVFFEGKFITLFSMLFGVSLLLVGGPGDDEARNVILRRRLAWLGAISLVHGLLIWSGDVLVIYAVCGVILYHVRDWPASRLIAIPVAIWVVALLLLIAMRALTASGPDGLAGDDYDLTANIAAYRGGLISATVKNIWTWADGALEVVTFYTLTTAPVMMLGMGLYKIGFFTGAVSKRLLSGLVAVAAVCLALLCVEALATLSNPKQTPEWSVALSWNGVLAPVVALGYAAALASIVRAGAVRAIMRGLQNIGRLALTNYLMQSLIMTTIFWGGRGFGLYGALDRQSVMMIVPAVWMGQWLFSALWLRAFTMGPAEWVWRRLSYGRAPAFRLATTR
jgi:uncharacterized protein